MLTNIVIVKYDRLLSKVNGTVNSLSLYLYYSTYFQYQDILPQLRGGAVGGIVQKKGLPSEREKIGRGGRSEAEEDQKRSLPDVRIINSQIGSVTDSGPIPVFTLRHFHPTLAPMTEHGHQNLSLMNEKLKFLHIYTRCFLDGTIPIQNNSTPFSSIINYETLNHKSVKEKDL